MRMYPSRILRHVLTLVFLWAVCSGCVKRMSAANEPLQAENSGLARIQSLHVSQDASQVELKSDRPLTYTSYKEDAPPRVVVDLSQAEPGPQAKPVEVNAGNVKRVDLVRQPVGGGVLTRVEIALAADADFEVGSDPQDKTLLVVKLAKPAQPAPVAAPPQTPAPAAAQGTPQVKEEAPLPEVKVEEKSLAPEAAVAAAPPVPPVVEAAPAPQVAPKAPEPAPAQGEEQKAPSAHPAERLSAPVVRAGERALTGISPTSEGIDLAVAGGVQTFNVFKLAKPERLVVDLFGVKNRTGKSSIPIGAQGIGAARVGSTPDKVRVVFDTAQEALPPFEVRPTDAGLRVRFKTPGAPTTAKGAIVAAPAAAAPSAPAPTEVAAAPAAAPVKTEVEVPAAVTTGKGSLEALDFKIVDNSARILMKLAGDCQAEQPGRSAKGLSLTIKNCQVPKSLQRTMDTSGFGSNVLAVVPYQVKTKGGVQTKVQVRLKESAPFTMFREGDTLVLEVTQTKPVQPVKPPVVTKEAAPAAEEAAASAAAPAAGEPTMETVKGPSVPKKHYTGRRVTLEFSDADIRKIFQLIAEVSNLNFLVADDVSGTISIKLVNVPWDQALDVILESKGLDKRQDGNILFIKPKGKFRTEQEEAAQAKLAQENNMEMVPAVFEVNFASVSDVAAQFKTIASDRAKNSIIIDTRTNKVIVTDIKPKLKAMQDLLKILDVPEKQVMIEARIVEASSDFTRDLGVQWQFHLRDGSASVANINAMDTTFGGIVSAALPTTTTGGLANAISFGKLTSNVQVDMRLSAAATVGQVKIISTPKVVTLNNKAAKISQGQSIPYQTTSAEGTRTEFVEAALTLEVTPHITPDGSVSMKIKASNNSPGAGTPPPINKKEATTELVVANGETTVIGGIYVDSDTETNTGVPFLSDIPLLGWLFKSNAKSKNKSELLIFITPKLVQ